MFLRYYNLREQPFGATPDPRFMLETPVHREALACLQYGIEAGRGFLGLIAAPGMGKTTLLFRLLEQLQGHARTAYLFHTQCDSRDFMRSLLSELKDRDRSTGCENGENLVERRCYEAVTRARQVTGAEGAAIALLENGQLVCRATCGRAPEVGTRCDPDRGLSGECFRTKRVVICENAKQDQRVPRGVAEELQIKSILIVPIIQQCRAVGFIEVVSSAKSAFHAAEVCALMKVTYSLSVSTDQQRPASYHRASGQGAAAADRLAMQDELHEILIRDSSAGTAPVVVIDEAQNLDDTVLETVRLLSNFETTGAKLLHIVLAGQTELGTRLSSPQLAQLRQRVSIVSRLAPLESVDVKRFVEHRLRVAGHFGAPLFTPQAYDTIARFSAGVPRNINNICFHALSLGYALGVKQIDGEMMQEVEADLNWANPSAGLQLGKCLCRSHRERQSRSA